MTIRTNEILKIILSKLKSINLSQRKISHCLQEVFNYVYPNKTKH